MKIKLLAILSVFLFGFSLYGEETRKDSVIVSVLTCAPGAEIYELCGHSAVRVRGEVDGHRIDSVWNYGIFDFSQPNFVYRFVKGETDYMCAGYPFSWFMPEYVGNGRTVVEQDLDLSQAEARKMLSLLRTNALPENRVYRYNYVRDNCATRITAILDSAADRRVTYPDSIAYGTFRREMRAYHKDYPWYQFGIDLALGSGLDSRLQARDEMFVPVEMMKKISGARYADGTPLMASSRVLYAGLENASCPPTPWYLTPMAVAVVLFVVLSAISLMEIRKRKIYRWVYTIWFGICGVGGCVIAFLVFVSTHEATSPNLLLIWLNPLQLLFAACVWSRKTRFIANAMAWLNLLSVGIMLLVWPFQAQSANPAFFPLMGGTWMLAAAYVKTYAGIITHKRKKP